MTSRTMTLDPFTLSASRTAAEDHAFRIVLMPGELLRVPRNRHSLQVVAGSAWVSHDGLDHVLTTGDELALGRSRQGTLVSAEGQALFLRIA